MIRDADTIAVGQHIAVFPVGDKKIFDRHCAIPTQTLHTVFPK